MGDSGGEHRIFSLNPKGAGTLKLQDVVQEKLLGFMEADYTDRVLAVSSRSRYSLDKETFCLI